MKQKRVFQVFVLVFFLMGLAQGVLTAQQADKFYIQRENNADEKIKMKLTSLREEIKSKNYTFQVGYTSAMDYTLEQITGLTAPPDLADRMKSQKTEAMKLMSKKSISQITGSCSAGAAAFDWRQNSGTTPVRDQQNCGSCWDFATHGAFEGSYRLINSMIIDSSEQDTLDCNPWGYSCKGGWWAFQYLIDTGSAKEAVYPYTAVKGACQTKPRPYKAASWGYVSTNPMPTVTELKQALCEYGPLAVAVFVTSAFQAYTGDVFNACINTDNVNHGVTLIGWDDGKGAWLIKNSWGTGWGSNCGFGTERGYMWIKYNCNMIGYGGAWVQALKKSSGCD